MLPGSKNKIVQFVNDLSIEDLKVHLTNLAGLYAIACDQYAAKNMLEHEATSAKNGLFIIRAVEIIHELQG